MEFLLLLIIILIIILLFGFFTVDQQTIAVIETFGKYSRIANAGLNYKIPIIQSIAGRVNLKIRQLDVDIETKTKDNVFVHVVTSVQFFVIQDKVYDAFYKLDNPEAQITSFVFDTVRAEVPNITIDDVFEKKDDIANAVKKELAEVMNNFGYGIVKALVTDINPNEKVKESMNEINAQERLKLAAEHKAQAAKITVVRAAEAEAESKALQGEGIANQRIAIIKGLKESVEDFRQSVAGANAEDVLNLVLMTQYFDTLKDVGANSRTNTIMIPHSPSGLSDIKQQIMESIITANRATDSQK